MSSIVQRKRAMITFANKNKMDTYHMVVSVPTWGIGAKKLCYSIKKKLGYPLTTEWTSQMEAHFLPAPPETIGQKALHIAITQIGVKENPPGSNSGVTVREYQATTGAFNAAWCASFFKWCLVKAGISADHLGHATADVTSYLAYPHISASNVKAGDGVIYQWGGGDVDHIGRFEKWVIKGHMFYAIEGNTSTSNDSNGGEVMRRLRSTSTVAAFIRVE